MPTKWFVIPCMLLAAGRAVSGGDAAMAGKLVEELGTLKCLGIRWMIGGDDNANARVRVAYRPAGGGAWREAMDLFRVDREGMRKATRPPAGQTLYAGSIFGLAPGTDYEVKLSLSDGNGGGAERTLRMRTWTEPKLPSGRRIDVRPGGLTAALAAAKPGETLVLHKGVYRGTFRPPSGRAGAPIALVGAGDGEAILDGRGASNVIDGSGIHDVMFERLSFRNARWAVAFNGGARITLRRCKVTGCEYAFVAQQRSERQRRIFLADNVFVGPSTWPRAKGIEDARAVQISGTGHVVCYNRIRGYADGIDTFSNYPCSAIDFYGNDISECTDDGIEMDYSEHNTRCFDNRLTNCYQGISVQPIHGGPVYVVRNAMLNIGLETFKMHNDPSGGVFLHNTSVRAGMPLVLYTGQPVTNFVMRNNLFVGTAGNYAYETTARMRNCDFDYDGFAGQWKTFLKWNRQRYATADDARAKAPVYRHGVRVESAGLFASGLTPPADVKKQFDVRTNDLRLKAGSGAIDAGAPLPNINDGFGGKAPDLGAYELGDRLPHYGPRRDGPTAASGDRL